MNITDYLVNIVKPMLKHPDYLNVTQSVDTLGLLLTIDVHKEDMGLLLGKKGETIKCIRHVLRMAGKAGNSRVSIKVNEPFHSG